MSATRVATGTAAACGACAASLVPALLGALLVGDELRAAIVWWLGALAFGALGAVLAGLRARAVLAGGPDTVSITGVLLFVPVASMISALVAMGVWGDLGGGNMAALAALFELLGAGLVAIPAGLIAIGIALGIDVSAHALARSIASAERPGDRAAIRLLVWTLVAGAAGAVTGALVWPLVASGAALVVGSGVRRVAGGVLALALTIGLGVHALHGAHRVSDHALPRCADTDENGMTPLVRAALAVPGVADATVRYDYETRIEQVAVLGPQHAPPGEATMAAVRTAIEGTACRELGREDDPLRAEVRPATPFPVDLDVALHCDGGPAPDAASVESTVREAFASGRIIDLGGPRQWTPPLALPEGIGDCEAWYTIGGSYWQQVWAGESGLQRGQYLELRSVVVH